MDQVYDEENIKGLTDDELRRLSNSAWYAESLELCYLCQEEELRRKREQVEKEPEPDA